ncbi:bifunctional adenosylcobinamide kinase/adenosylcobinamide-phosphate guanylyltransferase, partial [Blautia pseudococcoides]|nr:bifunctional adenosylcobinamide kinase/adenosylcobinamide-phosphate guanylyltransferase [Blautia pseudococcoides]
MITLVTGGSGSGKSAFAEDMLTGFGDGDRIYIATMYPFDEESKKR